MSTAQTKTCGNCGIEKPVSDFWLADKKYGYLRKNCKECDKAYQRLQYQRSEEFRRKAKANSSKWQKENPRPPAQQRRYSLKSMYGVTVEQYEAMRIAQGDKCALCSTDKVGRYGKEARWRAGHWIIDHCHSTGRVRGLLCHKCNVRVGAYEGLRDEIGLERLNAYLGQ